MAGVASGVLGLKGLTGGGTGSGLKGGFARLAIVGSFGKYFVSSGKCDGFTELALGSFPAGGTTGGSIGGFPNWTILLAGLGRFWGSGGSEKDAGGTAGGGATGTGRAATPATTKRSVRSRQGSLISLNPVLLPKAYFQRKHNRC